MSFIYYLSIMAMRRINLWSGPRNISTAMMYSFAQRSDCTVIDEPLYAYYLKETGIHHPGREEILQSQPHVGQKVIDEIILGDYPTEVVFFKQMTHHLLQLDRLFLNACQNIILIRHPKLVLHSYSKVISQPSIQDIGIVQSFELYRELKNSNASVLVMDSDDLLRKPSHFLSMLCSSLELDFDSKMLEWKAGARHEDGIWAKYWYDAVHKSTGFQAAKSLDFELPDPLNSLLEEALPFYNSLKEIALR